LRRPWWPPRGMGASSALVLRESSLTSRCFISEVFEILSSYVQTSHGCLPSTWNA
jgi:hypothetical protein